MLHLSHLSGGFLLAPSMPAAGTVVLLAGPPRAWCRGALVTVRAYIGGVHARPARTAALWGGSPAFVTLHCVVLITVTRAIALPLPPARVTLRHVAASTVAALLPTPC
jgi:hypothetical protein